MQGTSFGIDGIVTEL